MSTDTSVTKPPDPRLNVDLFEEHSTNSSGRTTPSSFRESVLGWGMSLVCGGVGYDAIDNREALVNYYNNATKVKQGSIIEILESNDKVKRLSLFVESMMHQCALNFIKGHSNRNNSESELIVYSDIEQFNATNKIQDVTKKFKISAVHDKLKSNNNQLIADNIITVCGALGLPYKVACLLINHPEMVYNSFNSTFNMAIGNLDGRIRGPALWVLYAIARQCFWSATCHVVDDLFIIERHDNHSQDEDLDALIEQVNLKIDSDSQVYAYRLKPLTETDELTQQVTNVVYALVPDQEVINGVAQEIVTKAGQGYYENKPEDLQASLLQLAYWLLPYQEETSAILGLYKQTSNFVPNSSCIKGIQPFSLSSLTDKIKATDVSRVQVSECYPMRIDFKYLVIGLSTALRRTYRHLLRHAKEKSWHLDNIAQSNEEAAQMKGKLLDLVFSIVADDWGGGYNGWST
jgi:hypothetical protein